jgi:hypothetical protein
LIGCEAVSGSTRFRLVLANCVDIVSPCSSR